MIMWNKVFNVQNPFWQTMNTVFDLFVANCLWLLCCIPIVTIGPATSALFYCLIERLQGDGSYIHQDFLRSFKMNLKQGMKLGIPLTLVGIFLTLDMYLCYHTGRGIYSFFLFFFGVFFVLWMMVNLYVFPILAKFERSCKEILILAFTFCIKNLPMTIMMLAFIGFSAFICRFIPGLIFIIVGICAQFCAPIMASIFKPFYPKSEEEEESGLEEGNPKTKDYMEYDNIKDLL